MKIEIIRYRYYRGEKLACQTRLNIKFYRIITYVVYKINFIDLINLTYYSNSNNLIVKNTHIPSILLVVSIISVPYVL